MYANNSSQNVRPIVNRSSPQAKGLVLCLPLFDGGSASVAREYARSRADFAFNSSTIAWAKGQDGTVLDMNGGYLTGPSVDLTGPDITVMARAANRKTSAYSSIIEVSGMQFSIYSNGSNNLSTVLYTSSGAAATSGTKTYAGAGSAKMFFVGFRWRASDSTVEFCVNGDFDKGLSRGLSIGAETINIGRFPGFAAFNSNGLYSDIRVYNFFAPDALFNEVYRNPKGLYRRKEFFWGKSLYTIKPISSTGCSGTGTASATATIRPIPQPHKYALEIRDKNFRLKQKIEGLSVGLQWEWNRKGGCGRATFTIPGDYLRINVQADDDVRLFLPDSGGTTATLWYRGYVESASPELNGAAKGQIRVECNGYSGWFDRIVVQDSNAEKVYTSTEVSLIVTSIVNTFLVPNSNIKLGTVDGSTYTPDSLQFKGTVKDALATLFDLLGDVEYGVDANLQFYWRNPSNTINFKYYVGDKVAKYSEKVDYRSIVNYIYLEGGDVAGVVLKATGSADDSIARYGKHEDVVSNGSIVSSSVANRYISGLLTQRSKPQRQLSASLKNISTRFEATLPMGAVSIIDHDAVQSAAKWGKTASGGSNKIYGQVVSGGSGQTYGGTRRDQIDRIQYTLSPEDGKVHADITLGTTLAVSRASAEIKRIEQIQNSIRQRQI